MEKQVVLFGAGASYGARNNPRPPLGKFLHEWVLKYFNKKFDDLDDWELEPGSEIVRLKVKRYLENATSYEALANTLWTGNGIDFLVKLNFLLAASMIPPINLDDPDEEARVNDSFVEKSDVYDQWLMNTVERRENLKNFAFMTLNYDCLLERAICRTFFTPEEKEGQCLCTHVHYPFIGEPKTAVEVLKLHGSINWIGDPLGNSGTNNSPYAILYDANNTPEYTNIEVVPTFIDRDPSEMIIATYAPGKPPQANPQLFQDIQNKAMERINEAQNIKIIGVHIPPNKHDDPSLWNLFLALRAKNVDFINPCEEENNLAKLSFGFNPIKKSFKEYVDSQT